jgi:uncharacterized protein
VTLYVDADACPVRTEAMQVAERLGVPAAIVSNGGLRPSAHPLVEMVFVPDGPDAADDWIAERAGPGDVVVTADLPLAGRVVAAGARVVTPKGEALTDKNIGPALASRNLMADLRAADPFLQGSGKGFTRADRSRFLSTLDRVLGAAKREARDDG